MKSYTVKAPIGNHVLPKEVMTEDEIRKYAAQIATDNVWREKAEKDPIEDVIDILQRTGYEIEPVE